MRKRKLHICIDIKKVLLALNCLVLLIFTTSTSTITAFSPELESNIQNANFTTIPENDLCSGGLPIHCQGIVLGSTSFATDLDAPDYCGTTINSSSGVWYTWIGTGEFAVLSTCNQTSNYDTKLAVFTGDCDDLNCVSGNDDDWFCSFSWLYSKVSFPSTEGEIYRIYVTGFGSTSGDFELSLNCFPPPTALCTSPIVFLDEEGNARLEISDIDNGSSVEPYAGTMSLVIDGQLNYSCEDAGTTNIVTLIVTDSNGSISTCESVVSIAGSPESIIIPENIEVFLDGNGEASISSPEVYNQPSSVCGAGSLVFNIYSFTCNDIGENTVTLNHVDAFGNTTSSFATITVADSYAPEIICHQPIVTSHTLGTCVKEDLVMLNPFVIYDNCGLEGITIESDRPNNFELGTTIVTWTVKDANGNPSTCQQEVTIIDNEFPKIELGNNISQFTDLNSCYATVFIDLRITDNCSDFTHTGLGAFEYTPGIYEHEIVATDLAGNSTIHFLNIVIQDAVAPEFTFCPEEIVLSSNTSENIVFPSNMFPIAIDNCELGSLDNNIPQNGFLTGMQEVIFTATDTYGNYSTCVINLIVEEEASISSNFLSNIESSLDENEITQIITWNPLNATTTCHFCEDTELEGFAYVGTWWGHQYFLANEISINREDARLIAESYNAHLAVINNAEENSYLQEALSNEVRTAWIGLLPQFVENEWSFVWDNEELNTYSSLDLAIEEITHETRIVLSQNGNWVAATSAENKHFLIERPCVDLLQTAPTYQENEEEVELLRSGDSWTEGEYEVVYQAIDMCGNELDLVFDVNVESETATPCTSLGLENDIWIENIVFHDLNNLSNNNAGYADFTGENISMNIGDGFVLLDLTAGGNTEGDILYWRIWLDKNGDGDFFDANETIFEKSTDILHIQENLELELENRENARLRVALSRHGFPAPCGDLYVGEVEDYQVTFLLRENEEERAGQKRDYLSKNRLESFTSPFVTAELFPNPANDFVNINLPDFEGEEALVQIFDNIGEIKYERKQIVGNLIKVDLGNFIDGIYHIFVRVEGHQTITRYLVINK